MKAGDAFGETALINDKPLGESVLCQTECHFAVLSKRKFEETLMKIEQNTKEGWKKFFRTHPLFDNLTLVSLEKLFYLIELRLFTRNQKIFKEGDEVKGFYLIYRGEACLSKRIEGNYTEKVNINNFMKLKNEINEVNESESYDINPFKSLYHSTINKSKLAHRFAKDLELRILGSGQFLGIEDALLKHSKDKLDYFSNTAVCKSAYLSVFYFDKEKCWEKLSYLGCMDQLTKLARKDFKRIKILNKQTVNTNKSLIESAISPTKSNQRVLSPEHFEELPKDDKQSNKVFSQWIDASSMKGFQLNQFWKSQEANKEDSEIKIFNSRNQIKSNDFSNISGSIILSSFSKLKESMKINEYEHPLSPGLSNLMLSSDFTNTCCATPVSKDSALNKNIRDFKLPKFSQFSRFKRDQNLNPQSSNNLTQYQIVQNICSMDKQSFKLGNQSERDSQIYKVKRVLKHVAQDRRNSGALSSESSNEMNLVKNNANIIKSNYINDNLNLNLSIPFNATNMKAISKRLKIESKLFDNRNCTNNRLNRTGRVCLSTTRYNIRVDRGNASPFNVGIEKKQFDWIPRKAFSPQPMRNSRPIPIACMINRSRLRKINRLNTKQM